MAQPIASHTETPSDALYRKFFKAGFLMLMVGAVWGVAVFLSLLPGRDFFQTFAHAHLLVFGFIGMFVMGFAYQAFPRFRYTSLQNPRWAEMSFYLMLAGVILHTTALTLASISFWHPLGVMSGLLELVAVTMFVSVIFQTAQKSPRPFSLRKLFAGDVFIVTALFMFWLQAALSPVLFWMLATSPPGPVLVEIIATWLGPFREVQFTGFALMMIIGVSLRMIPPAYGLSATQNMPRVTRLSHFIYALLLASFLLIVAGKILMHKTDAPLFGIGVQVGYLGLLVVGVMTAMTLGVFGKATDPDRSLKFVRAAFVWLLVALMMLNLMRTYNKYYSAATGDMFSHAYFNGYRHALTVGFIVMMVMGVTSKVVPTLRGRDARRLNALWLPFALINVGNVMRVSAEVITDFTPRVFFLTGIGSAFVFVAMLTWGIDLWRIMNAPAEGVPPCQQVKKPAGVNVKFVDTTQPTTPR
jgi:uncharacterized protein involved in response to NO